MHCLLTFIGGLLLIQLALLHSSQILRDITFSNLAIPNHPSGILAITYTVSSNTPIQYLDASVSGVTPFTSTPTPNETTAKEPSVAVSRVSEQSKVKALERTTIDTRSLQDMNLATAPMPI
ncbi:hypothetical protein M422DRAFT_277392 [Sphaerobolus stellatus SS14]|uniref:Uncharacterized protein n=1 Tax=Sphaerobolus stellatus (strain SS14) TaxID=990650 RepID=A0A0C9T0M0_SPHS4|nr:hypothetical protein M422DRAFT_277392 [Sphaerobolus stellatus SS14]